MSVNVSFKRQGPPPYQHIEMEPVPVGMSGTSRANAVAVLPTGEHLNPKVPNGATYYDPTTVVYVLFKLNDKRTRPTRVVTSAGGIRGWKLGTILHLEHDQTQAYLGEYMIVGVKDFGNDEAAADIPDRAIKHSVLK